MIADPSAVTQPAAAPPPQPDEDTLALMGLHPAQIALAHGLHSGAIHPQQVLDAATPKSPDQAQPAPAPAQPGAAPIATASAAPPIQVPPVGSPAAPAAAPSPSSAPVMATPGATPPPIAAPTRLSTDQDKLQHDTSTGSGLEQFQHRHPILGGIARVAAGVGSAMFPGVAANIPGTDIHHQVVLGQDRKAVGEDLGEQKSQADITKTGADTAKAGADTTEANARAGLADAQTDALGAPKPKEEKWSEFAGFTDNDGTPLVREENSGQVVRADNKKPPSGFKVSKPEAPFQTDKTTRVENGVPHEILFDKQTGKDVKDLGQTKLPGESADQKRSATESAQVERESRQNIRKAEGQYRATQQSVRQLNSSIDAAKDGNGLLTSFVPTMEVLGINASNGVHRISPAEAQAAGLPGGWSERFNAWFDKATTDKLSPQLQSEGKALGKILGDSAYQRYKSTYGDESGIVRGYGGTDFDKRVPLIQGGEEQGTGQGSGAPSAKKWNPIKGVYE